MLLLLLSCAGPDPDPEVTPFVIELTQGTVTLASPELAWPGVIGVPNLDDDDQDGTVDWNRTPGDDNDLTTFTIAAGSKPVKMSLSSGADDVRIWRDGAVVLDANGGEVALRQVDGVVTFQAEFKDFLSQGVLTVHEKGSAPMELSLTGAPLILNHHLQSSDLVMMMSANYGQGMTNQAMQVAYRENLPDDAFKAFQASSYGYDVWIQDEIEFATLTSTDGVMDVVIDSIRNGQGQAGSGLDNVPEDHFEGPDWIVRTWGTGTATGQDYFGNLEISPPVTVDGVEYPFGRIYYGHTSGQFAVKEALRSFLDSQKVQKPFVVDTSWLIVGHVDEYQTTIPDPSSDKGFKFLMADTRIAWELLEAADPDTYLTRYSEPKPYRGYEIDTIGEFLDDDGLRAVNEDVQDILDAELDKFIVELGLEEEDILYVPVLFYEAYSGYDAVVATTPGMVNLIVADGVSGTPTLFIPDPMMRTDVDDTSQDPFIAYMESTLPEGVDVVWMDDWYVYHMGLGEVHCGSNVVRPPAQPEWWVAGAHLLQDED